ncbi:MAG: hypothetical protein CMJ46_01920, partial [Planctomyces sp.]|nr:hypothetical protein [Planctomyces sp.]
MNGSRASKSSPNSPLPAGFRLSSQSLPIVNHDLIDQFEQLIRRDPGQRGLLGQFGGDRLIPTGSLLRAARELATAARHVVLVTGFYIPGAETPAS